MSKSSLWIVIIVTATWIGFLMGYAVSSHSGGAQLVAAETPVAESAGAGGYGR